MSYDGNRNENQTSSNICTPDIQRTVTEQTLCSM